MDAEYRPIVALHREVEVQLLPNDVDAEDLFATPEQLRDMAWGARLNRRGNTLIMFQVFFLSLVRPCGESVPDWDGLKQEYDRRLGFPSPEKSAALMEHFGEVHRVMTLRGCDGWPILFQMLGFADVSLATIDRMLFAAFQQATRLNYKMGG